MDDDDDYAEPIAVFLRSHRRVALTAGLSSVVSAAFVVAYLGWLSFLPRMVGRLLARRKQAGVAFDRMRMLVAETDDGALDSAPQLQRWSGVHYSAATAVGCGRSLFFFSSIRLKVASACPTIWSML